MTGYVDFEFDLPGALLTRLVQVLDELTPAPLDPSFLTDIPDAQGVYQLFLDGVLIYIGKTDAEAGLCKRLERHQRKVQHRDGLNPSRVSFKAVRIYVFTAVDLETQLIEHYGGYAAVRWNGSGFGSNDPGRERDTTTYKAAHFDATFPIDIERSLPVEFPKTGTAAALLAILRRSLPYTFRYENAGGRSRRPHPDLERPVSLSAGSPMTARRIIQEIVAQLPAGWQATKLPSHIILYKETPRAYVQGVVIGQSP